MKNKAFGLISTVVLLSGCTQQVLVAESAATIYLTRPSAEPADTSDRIPDHELWCYRTMGDPQCYSSAQDVPPSRLSNVSPQRILPLTAEAYREEVNRQQIAMATGGPTLLNAREAPSAEDDKPWWTFLDFMIP